MEVDRSVENVDVITRRKPCSIPINTPPSNSDPGSVPAEIWEVAEEATREIVCRIHPTIEDDQKRNQVIEYVQGLIKRSRNFQVFPYGSVPLKTYLPDGDIDLTVISNPNFEDTLVRKVCTVLRAEEINRDALYEVKDVRFIDVEVKLVKCFVQNIVVDISFNQIGGLSTLCFLEKVDWRVGRNNLFKRSIILIKAWCYYESRILGAHHGLISTYALETLILYIFHLFHCSLNGPLAVLYRFLDYFSKFDWDNFIVSLNGPACKSSLAASFAEPLESKGKLLFSDDFLKECTQMFKVPSRNELNLPAFPQKHLNIIDPLKENNNLGRSVNRGNFYRVRSAFKYGARKLGQILVLPKEKIVDELNSFFSNTLVGHGSNDLNEFQNLSLNYGARISDNVSYTSLLSQSDMNSAEGIQHPCFVHQSDREPSPSPSDFHLKNVVSSREMVGKFSADKKLKCRPQRETQENRSMISGPVSSCSDHGFVSLSIAASSAVVDNVLDKLHRRVGATETANDSGNSESFKSLLDLTGDYKAHSESLIYVQYCHLYPTSAPVLPPMFPQSSNKNSPEAVSRSLHVHQNGYSLSHVNGVFLPPFYCMSHSAPFNTHVVSEEKKSRRGTGTYIPNMSSNLDRDRWLPSRRERNLPPGFRGSLYRYAQDKVNSGQLHRQRHAQDNVVPKTLRGISSSDHIHDLSDTEYPFVGQSTSQCHQNLIKYTR